MKKIAVIGNRAYSKNENYYSAIEHAGGEPAALELFNYSSALSELRSSNALVIPGGTDINPSLYREENTDSLNIDDELDRFEWEMIDEAVKLRLPILGICRGLQLLNVYFGGSLIQNISCCDKHKRMHHIDNCHNVQLKEHSFLYEIYGEAEIPVNSAHHQAVKKLGSGLSATAYSCCERITEAIEHESLPVYGVQFHPERMCLKNKRDDTVDGLRIFEYFINNVT